MKGSVASLWRYPVSSMGGERLERAPVAVEGVVGDRLFGLLDRASGRIASPGRETHFAAVPKGHARLHGRARVEISADGTSWAGGDDPAVLAALARLVGFEPELKSFVARGEPGFRPRYEHAPIHLLTSAAMRSLARERPDSVIDERRFRPNIMVEWPDEAEPMPERDWIGREIRIGEVVLKGREPCKRCGFTTIEQDGLPLDVEILRTVVRRYERNFGIYCDVLVPGEIRTGDGVAVAPR